jgi:hypothetical protein
MPKVFVGHPFGGRFPTKKFREIFKSLPFTVIYGNTDLQTKHLLMIMKSNISKSDFSIFDLSNWNPNVALELGLAEGLKKKANKNYYILLNTRRSREVPSDIRGIQRLEYTSYDFKPEVGLGDQLVQYILSKEYWTKRAWKEIPSSEKGEKQRLLVLRIIAHLRDHEKLTSDNLKTLLRGTRLRKADSEAVLEILRSQKLIKKGKRKQVFLLGKRVFHKN